MPKKFYHHCPHCSKRIEVPSAAVAEIKEGFAQFEKELARVTELVDRTADGEVILGPGPVVTPDGRHAYIEPFYSTPTARWKCEEDSAKDEYFEGRNCYSTREAYEASKKETDHVRDASVERQ